ncbi:MULTISPECIES: hypothetical protein [unclassified Actinomyces]|uniref:hypothetical protein n=1 Tax=unclassified Actinomyces TaxID=2609248 RepID=UPI001379ECD9|nr:MULTISPECIES: hypothetical protein [unclassified Actinomyces]NDR53295.1 hypothetical protein [Actinomyces sp. 565]
MPGTHSAPRKHAQMQATLPPEDLEAMLDLSRFLGQVAEPAALVGPDGKTVGLPAEVHRVLMDVVHAMSQGRAIMVAPVDQVLTTQEAADYTAALCRAREGLS